MAALIPVAAKFVMSPIGIASIAGGVMALGLVVQTARLNHAKADQVDPSTHVKWEKEYKDAAKLAFQNGQKWEACNAGFLSLSANVAAQNQAVVELQSSAQQAANAATRMAADAHRTHQVTQQQVRAINAVKETACPSLDSLREANDEPVLP